MRCSRRCLFAGSAVLIALVFVARVGAQDSEREPDLANPAQTSANNGNGGNGGNGSTGANNGNGNNANNNQNNGDQESASIQTQMETVKRELRGQKVDLSKAAPIRDRLYQFQLRVPNYIQIRQRNIVMQQRDYSCGAACLATILRYYWEDDVTEDMVLEGLDKVLKPEEIPERIKNGLAMTDLRRAAVEMGYQAVVGQVTFEKLSEVKVPVIVGIEPMGHKHFVVYRGTDIDWVYVADPIRGNIRIETWEFRKQWQKNAVLAVNKPNTKVRDMSPLSLTPMDVDRTQLNDFLIQTQQSRWPQTPLKTGP